MNAFKAIKNWDGEDKTFLLTAHIFLPFALGYFFSYLVRNANAGIAPELIKTFSLTSSQLGLLTASYLIAFGSFQLPLGILLDRFGPRRVEAVLLSIAALGCALFASAGDFFGLSSARAVIGLGASACLMASFKAFSIWFKTERLAALNAAVMAAGGLGALAATLPLNFALPYLGWRGIFYVLAGIAASTACIVLSVPEKRETRESTKFAELANVVLRILLSRAYWRFAPQTAFVSGGFMALQGLWAVPWLMTVNGHSQTGAAEVLFGTSLAMLLGFLGLALGLRWLYARGLTLEYILILGNICGITILALMVAGAAPSKLLWFAYGIVFAVNNLSYAAITQEYQPNWAGRVNTTLNLAAFGGAAFLQWCIGVSTDFLTLTGLTPANAMRWNFAALAFLQILSLILFCTLKPRPHS